MMHHAPRPALLLPVALLLLLAPVVRGTARGAPAPGDFVYASPVPGSDLVSPGNNVVLRAPAAVDPATVADLPFLVRGSRSGVVPGRLRLAPDGRSLIFRPDRPYALGETVTVSLGEGLRTLDGTSLEPVDFSFRTGAVDPARMPRYGLREFDEAPRDEAPRDGARPLAAGPVAVPATGPCDGPLPGMPLIDVAPGNDPADGLLFVSPFEPPATPGRLLILDDQGQPIYFRASQNRIHDFKRQPSGLLTYFEYDRFFGMDSTYTVVDTFQTGNGYATDLHDLIVLPGGHTLMMSYDPQFVGMDTVVVGGSPDAVVIGLIIQELDENDNVVFQWRSWDHFEITDASVSELVDFMSLEVDYVHGNSIDLDDDGNLLISSRHMNEITKIDRDTGDIIWRFGPNAVNNDFTVVGDPRGFSHQHDARRDSNGNLTLFDNGNFLSPAYSRAVEYELDTGTMTATLVWEYRHLPDDVTGPFMGNVQELPGGGRMIGWGGSNTVNATQLESDGTTLALDLDLDSQDPNERTYSYRTFRFPWTTSLFSLNGGQVLDFGTISDPDPVQLPVTVENHGADSLRIDCDASSDPRFAVVASLPLVIAPGDSATIDVLFDPDGAGERAARVYLTSVRDSTQLIGAWLDVTGIGSEPTATPDLGTGRGGRLTAGYPNPFRARTRIGFRLEGREEVSLRVYDAQGRLVRILADGSYPAGTHQVTWDRMDDRGRPVAAGVYFYRLAAAGFLESRRLVVLR